MIEVEEITPTPQQLNKVIYRTATGQLRYIDGDQLTLPQRLDLLQWQEVAAGVLKDCQTTGL